MLQSGLYLCKSKCSFLSTKDLCQIPNLSNSCLVLPKSVLATPNSVIFVSNSSSLKPSIISSNSNCNASNLPIRSCVEFFRFSISVSLSERIFFLFSNSSIPTLSEFNFTILLFKRIKSLFKDSSSVLIPPNSISTNLYSLVAPVN